MRIECDATLAEAIAGVLAAPLVALADPSVIVVGGTWGGNAELLHAVQEALGELRRRPEVRTAAVSVEASLAGARQAAVEELRTTIVARTSQPA